MCSGFSLVLTKMKNYSACASSNNTIKVFDVKSGITAFNIPISNCAKITSVLPTSDSLTVTFETTDGKLKSNVYNLEKGILRYSNFHGNVESRKLTTQSKPHPPRREDSLAEPEVVSAPSDSISDEVFDARPISSSRSYRQEDPFGAFMWNLTCFVFLLSIGTGLVNMFVDLHAALDKIHSLHSSFDWKWILIFIAHSWVWIGQAAWWILSTICILVYKLILFIFKTIHDKI
jgi:hypothetical protein